MMMDLIAVACALIVLTAVIGIIVLIMIPTGPKKRHP